MATPPRGSPPTSPGERTPLRGAPAADRSSEVEDRRALLPDTPSTSIVVPLPARSNRGVGFGGWAVQTLLTVVLAGLLFWLQRQVLTQHAQVAALSRLVEQQAEVVSAQQSSLDSMRAQLHNTSNALSQALATLENEERAELSYQAEVDSKVNALAIEYARFNSTVTNSEVLVALAATEDEVANGLVHINTTLESMKAEVRRTMAAEAQQNRVELTSAEADVLQQMAQTNSDLNKAVRDAEATINQQVASVKDDVANYVADTNTKFAAENDFLKYQLSGTFTLLAVLVALWHVTHHVRHLHQPLVQRRILAILWMVPVYGVTSWLSLVFPQARRELGVARDCYEAYAVYTFFAFLLEVLRGDGQSNNHPRLSRSNSSNGGGGSSSDQEVVALLTANAQRKVNVGKGFLRPPFYLPCGLARVPLKQLARAALWQCRFCLMQFVMLKPVLTLLPFVLNRYMDYYGRGPTLRDAEGHVGIDWLSPQLWVMVASNFSVALAFYGLMSFYHAVDEELKWVDPWPKFMCIKGVVFATFWQGFIISLCAQVGFLDQQAAFALQDFLICVEMLLASLAHYYIFPPNQWTPGFKAKKVRALAADEEDGMTLQSTFAVGDFFRDVREVMARSEKTSDGNLSVRSSRAPSADLTAPDAMSFGNNVSYGSGSGGGGEDRFGVGRNRAYSGASSGAGGRLSPSSYAADIFPPATIAPSTSPAQGAGLPLRSPAAEMPSVDESSTKKAIGDSTTSEADGS